MFLRYWLNFLLVNLITAICRHEEILRAEPYMLKTRYTECRQQKSRHPAGAVRNVLAKCKQDKNLATSFHYEITWDPPNEGGGEVSN